MDNEKLANVFEEVIDRRIVGHALHSIDAARFKRELIAEGYLEKPASIHHHGTNRGDLFRHSLRVAEILVDYTEKLGLEWQRDCSPWVIGLFHDLCKTDDYICSEQLDIRDMPRGWELNDKKLLNGHGEKSVMLISRYMPLTEEEILCIRYHMGAYRTDDWGQFDLAIRKYQNVLYTHMADMAASKIFDI